MKKTKDFWFYLIISYDVQFLQERFTRPECTAPTPENADMILLHRFPSLNRPELQNRLPKSIDSRLVKE